jgi:arylformamidase
LDAAANADANVYVYTDWRTLDAATLEREMSPSSCIGGDYRPFVDAYASRSAEVRAAFARGSAGRWWPDLAYGPTERERLDLFVPQGASHAPLLVFIHGGYWQELSKAESQFAALDAVQQGVALAVVDYTLAPEASVREIVEQCRRALRWLHLNAGQHGADAQRMVVGGSSAGAHLAAMCALPEACCPGIVGAVLLSGVYELEPLVGTTINEALALNTAEARALSPALMAASGFPPTVLAWGQHETDEFKRQSLAYTRHLAAAGVTCTSMQVPQRNHFDIVFDLIAGSGPLPHATRQLLIT